MTYYDAPNQEVVRAAPPSEGGGADGDVFDPAEHTVSEVQDYVSAHPDERAAIRRDEEQGKARVTLLDWFDET